MDILRVYKATFTVRQLVSSHSRAYFPVIFARAWGRKLSLDCFRRVSRVISGACGEVVQVARACPALDSTVRKRYHYYSYIRSSIYSPKHFVLIRESRESWILNPCFWNIDYQNWNSNETECNSTTLVLESFHNYNSYFDFPFTDQRIMSIISPFEQGRDTYCCR